MQDILSLVADHDRLSADARNLAELAASPTPRPEEAFDALGAFRCALNAHLSSESQFLTGADQIGRVEFSAFAAEQDARFSDLTQEWDVYLSEWSEENMREDWASFTSATGWIMSRLCDYIRMENDVLYPLALKHGLISLRPH